MDVDDPAPEAVEEWCRQQVHVARQYHELHPVLLEPGRHHEVALLPVWVAVQSEARDRDACRACTDKSVGVAAVGGDGRKRQPRVYQRLQVGGRMIVLAYHSLEDRPVKQHFRDLVREGLFAALTRKALRPSANESASNPRARSARLRCIERVVQ